MQPLAVINAGSSSIKFALFEDNGEFPIIFRGQVEKLGVAPRLTVKDAENHQIVEESWAGDELDHASATTTILALAPLARAGLIGDLVVDAKSGVSGAGRDPKPDMMFGEVNESVKAYGIGGHRHVAEIEQELASLGGDVAANPGAVGVDFLPHLIPMSRGILSACHVRATQPVSQAELDRLYTDAYANEPFIRLYQAGKVPDLRAVARTNFCDIGVSFDAKTGRAVVVSAIDNLVKGAAGQAVQNMNLMLGYAETEALL